MQSGTEGQGRACSWRGACEPLTASTALHVAPATLPQATVVLGNRAVANDSRGRKFETPVVAELQIQHAAVHFHHGQGVDRALVAGEGTGGAGR